MRAKRTEWQVYLEYTMTTLDEFMSVSAKICLCGEGRRNALKF